MGSLGRGAGEDVGGASCVDSEGRGGIALARGFVVFWFGDDFAEEVDRGRRREKERVLVS